MEVNQETIDFNTFFNSADAMYYLPELSDHEKQEVKRMLKTNLVDLTYRDGLPLIKCVERYGIEFLRHVSQESFTVFTSDEFRSNYLSMTIARRYIKERDIKPLMYLLDNDTRDNRGSKDSYKHMLTVSIIDDCIITNTIINQKNVEELWHVLYKQVPLHPSSIRHALGEYLVSITDYTEIFRTSKCSKLVSEAYIDYGHETNNNRIFPLREVESNWDYESELYLKLVAEYLSGTKTLADIIPWNLLERYPKLINDFILYVPATEELQVFSELDAMRIASKTQSNFHLILENYNSVVGVAYAIEM